MEMERTYGPGDFGLGCNYNSVAAQNTERNFQLILLRIKPRISPVL